MAQGASSRRCATNVKGIETIAGFVARAAIIKAMGEIGVDHAQGFAVNEPHPFQMTPMAALSLRIFLRDVAWRRAQRFLASTATMPKKIAADNLSAVEYFVLSRAVHFFGIGLRALSPHKRHFRHQSKTRDAELTPLFNFRRIGSVRSFLFAVQQLSVWDDVVVVIHPNSSFHRRCSGHAR